MSAGQERSPAMRAWPHLIKANVRRRNRVSYNSPVGKRVDPITVSVVQHRLHGIVEEMGEAMLRTSYSQILNSSRDFSTAICDAQGRLVAQAEHVPIHVGALPWAAQAVGQYFGGTVRPGDVFLLNDPYHGNNHLPDVTVFVPVFAGERLLFWSINRSHQSDIGGATHGGYNPAATEIWQEGLRIPPLRLFEAGAVREDVLNLIALNVRHERDFRGDLAAMIGSARTGERRLAALLDEYGEEGTRAAVEAVLDDDGHGARDVRIRAEVTKRGSSLAVDLTDSDPQVAGFINSSYANMRSAVAMALAYLIDPETPKNDGTFRPLSVEAREGTVVWARPPAPVTLSTNHCGQEICEAILKALARACPERVMAGWGRRFHIAIQGKHPRTGRTFIWHLFHARPGGGASAAGDGWPGAGEWQAAGGIKFGSVEVMEARFPLFFRRHEFRPDSGGDGRYRGGPGCLLELAVETEEPARANTAGDGARHGACGMAGGADGQPHRYRLRSGVRLRTLQTKETGVLVHPGDVFLIESAGGGGWGDPRRRAAEARARDLENGFVTRRTRSRRPR